MGHGKELKGGGDINRGSRSDGCSTGRVRGHQVQSSRQGLRGKEEGAGAGSGDPSASTADVAWMEESTVGALLGQSVRCGASEKKAVIGKA